MSTRQRKRSSTWTASTSQASASSRSSPSRRVSVWSAVTDEVYFNNHPRIYVGRLNGSVKRKELLDMFAKYGEIVDILMKEDFAFVEYIKPEAAQQAIKELNGKCVGSARIVVEEARPRLEEGTRG